MITENEVLELAAKLRPSLKIQNEMGFADMPKAPGIDYYPDMEQFYSPQRNEIHLGAIGIFRRFGVKTEEDFLEATNFVRGHEEEHCRSTATRPYCFGIQKGTEEVIRFISGELEGKPRNFRSEKDYKYYADKILPSKGICISYDQIAKIIGGIANSLEDGRIERIRSARYPGFALLRTKYRGIFWNQSGDVYPKYDELKDDAPNRLRIITNQILCLSTCQVYGKGFVLAYAGTPLMDEVNMLIPYIRRAFLAKRCRGMADETIAISKILAPYIFKAAEAAAKDAKAMQILMDIIRDLIDKMIESGNPGGDLSERDEKTDETGSSGTAFSKSDLMRDTAESGKSQGNKTSETEEKTQATAEDDGNDDGSEIPDSFDDSGFDDSGSSDDQGCSEKTGSGKKSESESEEESEEEPGEEKSEGKKMQDSSSSKAAGIGNPADYDESEILSEMEKAAEATREEAKETINSIHEHTTHEKRSKKEKPDKEKPLNEADISAELKHEFKEFKRKYEVKDKLPAVLKARGRAMYRKNQRYFKSLSRPTVKNLDTGSVDPSRIYGLSFGDTEIFQKIGKDKQFDGCAYLLIDNSGSMRGDKRIEACKAGAVIEEGFHNMFPMKIVAFDSDGIVMHEVIKNWDEWLHENCCWNFALHGRNGYGNEDGYDIKIATKELLARPERKKMLCVLSDGAPGNRTLVRDAVRDARRKGIEVFSIFFSCYDIDESDVRDMRSMYERDFICCELSQLDTELDRLFKKFSRS